MKLLLATLLMGVYAEQVAQPVFTRTTPMDVRIGMLMPIGVIDSDGINNLGSLGSEAREKMETVMVAASLINKDQLYNVNIQIDRDNHLLDSGEDKNFKTVTQGDSIAGLTPALESPVFDSQDQFAQDNSGSTLCLNARTLCQASDIKAIIGGYRSSRSIGMAHCCMTKDGLPHVSPGSTSAFLTKYRSKFFPYFFRTVPNDDYQGVALSDLAQKNGFTRVSVVYTDDAYSKGMADKFIEVWEGRGFTITPKGGVSLGKVDHGSEPSDPNDEDSKTFAQLAVERIRDEGDSSVIVLTTISHDADALMTHFGNYGMKGAGWAFLGADGSTSTNYMANHLSDEYLGMAGTTPKLPLETNPLYLRFVDEYTKIVADRSNELITSVPWQGKDTYVVGAFTAQTYDAVAAIAMAATRWLELQPSCEAQTAAGKTNSADCCDNKVSGVTECSDLFTRDKMKQQLEAGVIFMSLSGTAKCPITLDIDSGATCLSLFDAEAGGQDGDRIYTLVNAVGDNWDTVGSWTDTNKLSLTHTIEWPGGTTTPPDQTRPCTATFQQGCGDDDDGAPKWVVPVVVIIGLAVAGLFCCMCYMINKGNKVVAFDAQGSNP